MTGFQRPASHNSNPANKFNRQRGLIPTDETTRAEQPIALARLGLKAQRGQHSRQIARVHQHVDITHRPRIDPVQVASRAGHDPPVMPGRGHGCGNGLKRGGKWIGWLHP